MQFLARYADALELESVIGLENFRIGEREWLNELAASLPERIEIHPFDVVTDEIADVRGAAEGDFVIHLASIASPIFYRIYPFETVDANVTGLRRLLDFYADKDLRGFLYFSSSEVYGDPLPGFVPTSEEYRGNVASMGPRACYDEGKRFGETLCYLFAKKFQVPVRIARPFNNYGPGMSLNDGRLPADLASAIVCGRDLEIYSDGSPTRTLCYTADALAGYLKVMLHDEFDVFNIGMDRPELTVNELVEIFRERGREVFGYEGEAIFRKAADKEYLADNPKRRCPDIGKARRILGFDPRVGPHEGVGRFLEFIKQNREVS
jgi:UDP-glucuronate decarboxylase